MRFSTIEVIYKKNSSKRKIQNLNPILYFYISLVYAIVSQNIAVLQAELHLTALKNTKNTTYLLISYFRSFVFKFSKKSAAKYSARAMMVQNIGNRTLSPTRYMQIIFHNNKNKINQNWK